MKHSAKKREKPTHLRRKILLLCQSLFYHLSARENRERPFVVWKKEKDNINDPGYKKETRVEDTDEISRHHNILCVVREIRALSHRNDKRDVHTLHS